MSPSSTALLKKKPMRKVIPPDPPADDRGDTLAMWAIDQLGGVEVAGRKFALTKVARVAKGVKLGDLLVRATDEGWAEYLEACTLADLQAVVPASKPSPAPARSKKPASKRKPKKRAPKRQPGQRFNVKDVVAPAVLQSLEKKPQQSQAEIAEAVGVPRAVANQALQLLKKGGQIVAEGATRARRYSVSERRR